MNPSKDTIDRMMPDTSNGMYRDFWHTGPPEKLIKREEPMAMTPRTRKQKLKKHTKMLSLERAIILLCGVKSGLQIPRFGFLHRERSND